jgi:hypothetical protein
MTDGNAPVFFFTFTVQKLQENWQGFKRINNCQERCEHPNKQC